jgi:hypothetical protein
LLQPIINEFTKEQKKFVDENREKKRQAEAAVPPWVGYNEEEQMKDQIMALSLVSPHYPIAEPERAHGTH